MARRKKINLTNDSIEFGGVGPVLAAAREQGRVDINHLKDFISQPISVLEKAASVTFTTLRAWAFGLGYDIVLQPNGEVIAPGPARKRGRPRKVQA